MTQANLTLYHYWRSSCSWRLRWALAIKQVTYTSVPVDILALEHQSAAYLAKNPAGFLPALAIGDTFYGESLALIDWLEEAYPSPSLYPKEALARLRVRQLALTIAAGTQPLQNPSLMKYFVPVEADRPKHMRHFIARGLGVYEQLLASTPTGRFSWGDTPTVADLCLIPQVYNALRFAVDLSSTPKVRGIYERALATDTCAAAAPDAYKPA